jgi:hypothetical protein
MSSKIEVPITSEDEDIEKQMAVVQQPTGTCDEADINTSVLKMFRQAVTL